MTKIESRMKIPVLILPDALQALNALGKAAKKGNIPLRTITLVHSRASQINGCSVCVDMHSRELKESGETNERLFAVSAWRETGYFNAAERAALALTEAATRLSDRSDPVPDDIWAEATRHYTEQELAVLVMNIALINFWNRINATTRQVVNARAPQELAAAAERGD